MSITDLFRFGFINLWRRKTRTFLTALSMAIGVMCIVVLISVGLGYEQSYRESVESMGSLTKIDVRPADETLRHRNWSLRQTQRPGLSPTDGQRPAMRRDHIHHQSFQGHARRHIG